MTQHEQMYVKYCVSSTVYYKCCQGTGHLLLAAHAGQGAEFCQRPLPDGQRDPQPASPAKTERSLHSDRRPSSPGGKKGV